jgi:hypothetical protein
MNVRFRDDALPGKGQQSREQDKPPRPRPHAGQILPPRAPRHCALSINGPAIGQSRAFRLIIRAAARFLATADMLHCINNQPEPALDRAIGPGDRAACRSLNVRGEENAAESGPAAHGHIWALLDHAAARTT